jgi:hypothetical protein
MTGQDSCWVGADAEDDSRGWDRRFSGGRAGVVAGLVPWWLTGWRMGSSYPVPVRVVAGL